MLFYLQKFLGMTFSTDLDITGGMKSMIYLIVGLYLGSNFKVKDIKSINL